MRQPSQQKMWGTCHNPMRNTMKQPKDKVNIEVRYKPKQEVSAGLSRLYDLLLATPAVNGDALPKADSIG